jgi:hypothetical protein
MFVSYLAEKSANEGRSRYAELALRHVLICNHLPNTAMSFGITDILLWR